MFLLILLFGIFKYSPKINENRSQIQNFYDLFWIANEILLCNRI